MTLNPLIGESTSETLNNVCMALSAIEGLIDHANDITGATEAIRIIAATTYAAANYERVRTTWSVA